MSATTVSREGFGVSCCCGDGKVVATPTRHFKGSLKFLKCELHGRQFPTSDEAFAAMVERGYNDLHYPRSSVPISTFAKLNHVQRQCRFDAEYRLFRHLLRLADRETGLTRALLLEKADKMHPTLRRTAAKVGIFHPVANAINKGRL